MDERKAIIQLLFKLLNNDNPTDSLLIEVKNLSDRGFSKKEIYSFFLDLHILIQKEETTKDNDSLYDTLSDFMDGFTIWSKTDKILPDEPDVDI